VKSILAVLIAMFVAVLIGGCDNGGHVSHEQHGHAHDQHANSDATALQLVLNDGERWQMDEHTRKMMAEMEAVFAAADHANQASLNAAGRTMAQQIEDLVVGCTMDGKAHEQLHIFLGDYIPTVNALASAEGPEQASELAHNIQAQLDNYRKHFK